MKIENTKEAIAVDTVLGAEFIAQLVDSLEGYAFVNKAYDNSDLYEVWDEESEESFIVKANIIDIFQKINERQYTQGHNSGELKVRREIKSALGL